MKTRPSAASYKYNNSEPHQHYIPFLYGLPTGAFLKKKKRGRVDATGDDVTSTLIQPHQLNGLIGSQGHIHKKKQTRRRCSPKLHKKLPLREQHIKKRKEKKKKKQDVVRRTCHSLYCMFSVNTSTQNGQLTQLSRAGLLPLLNSPRQTPRRQNRGNN